MRLTIITTLILLFPYVKLSAQGCNDAGFCTIGHANNATTISQAKNSLKFTQLIGLGEQNTLISTTQIDIGFSLNDKLMLQLRSPFSVIYGDLGTTAGLGDFAISLNQDIIRKNNLKWSITAGSKIPTGDANIQINQRPLPMVYQSSQGSYDMVLSSSLFLDNWHLAIGYQRALTANKNEFYHQEGFTTAREHAYFESARLKRGDDVMLRVERYFELDKGKIFAGVLPIYRLSEDEIETEGQKTSVEGTTGLTFNLNLAYLRQFKNNNFLKISAAAPLITRDVRTDGLTRTFVINLSYIFNIIPLPKETDMPKQIFKIEN